MAKINTVINAEEIEIKEDFNVYTKEKMTGITARLPEKLVDKLKVLKKDLEVKGHKVTISDLIRGAVEKVFGEVN